MLGNVQRQGSFPDARAGSDDDQVRLLESAGLGIQVGEAAGNAREQGLVFVDSLDLVPGLLEDILQRYEVLSDAALGDTENDALRLV